MKQCPTFIHTFISFLLLFQYKLTVPKMGNVADLLAVLTKETNIPTDKVIMYFLSLVYIFQFSSYFQTSLTKVDSSAARLILIYMYCSMKTNIV